MGKVIIVGALTEEVGLFRAAITNQQERNTVFGPIYEGEMYGKEICLIKSGVGKVMTAAATQMICQLYDIDLIIFTGVGGALNPNYQVGDVCIGVESIQYDLDASAAGFEIGQVPFTDFRIFKSDPKAVQILRNVGAVGITLHYGRIATGDTFVSTDTLRATIRRLECDLVDMETAAMAQVATLHNAPFISIRSVSDTADQKASESFYEMLPKLAAKNFAVVARLIRG